MKKLTSIITLCSIFLIACQPQADPLPNSKAKTCPYPSFELPPRYVSGCANACQYLYQGELNFQQQSITINCETHQLPEFCNMEWYIDPKGYPVYAQGTYWPAIYIKLHNIDSPQLNWLCSSSEWFEFEYLGSCPFKIRYKASVAQNNGSTIAIRLVPEPYFWDCYNQLKYPADFWFQLISTTPIKMDC